MKYKIDNIKKDVSDSRDLIYSPDMATPLPNLVDLRRHAGAVENQLRTGSCVANAAVSALEILLTKANDFKDLSRLFLYYNLREPYEHLNQVDEGSYLRDAFKSVYNKGICLEKDWQFIEGSVLAKPNPDAYRLAQERKAEKYERVVGQGQGLANNVDVMKVPLAKGYPLIVSMRLGRSFYDIKGQLDFHGYHGVNNDLIGGHAMCIVGYRDDLNSFLVENSWGASWGDGGYCAIDYQVMVNDMMDCWVCTEFAGHEFEDEFILDQVPLTVGKKSTCYHRYQGDRLKNSYMLADAKGGIPPYTYDFKEPTGFSMQRGENNFFHHKKTVGTFVHDDFTSPFLCYITDSSIPQQTKYQEFITEFEDKSHNLIQDIDGIIKLYIAYFNRVPDSDGVSYWVDAPMTFEHISRSFANIAFTTVYGNGFSYEDFIKLLYLNLMNNADPDPVAVTYWIDKIPEIGIGKVAISILNCIVGEYKLYLDNKGEVCRRYLDKNLSYDLTKITLDVKTVETAIRLLEE